MRAVKEAEEEDVEIEDEEEGGGEAEEEEDDEEEEEEINIDEQLEEVEEDYNRPAEDEGENDLFDSDENEDYAKTTAVSFIRPPRPPPPTNFPKRQDYHEASWGGGRQGGGRHGGGRGGRQGDRGRHGGDREWFGSGGRHGRLNCGGGVQGYGGGGRRFQNENLVAEMKLGASGHGDASLRLKCPPFQEPSQLACYSRAPDGDVHWDDRCLRRFRSGILSESGADLNEGYESYVEKREDSDGSGSGFGDLLACLRAKRISLDNIHFVTFRNNLNKILGTAYNRFDAWEMGVYKRFGTIYLDVRKLPEGPQSEQQRRNCYWGYSFERLATENRNGPRPVLEMSRQNGVAKSAALDSTVVDANVEFCAVLRTKLGPHRIIMGAEMDCYEPGRDGRKTYVELKTSRELEPRTVDKFEKDKLLKFWIQSFLAGVPRIVCGFRDDRGRLTRAEMMSTKDITQRVKLKHLWEGGVCLAFADQVFCWLYGSVKEGENYLLRFIPAANRLELLRESSCPEIITKHLEELSNL
ncbi:unnamed protein product [Calypogeia fissa]